MNDLQGLFADMAFRIERLESSLRMLKIAAMELSKENSVLNRKVELILDQQQTDSFLEEENFAEKTRNAHPEVQ